MTTLTAVHGEGRSARDEPRAARLVLVGGVPGAGKTTLLAHARFGLPRTRMLDPDWHRRRLAAALPASAPYRSYRPLVHALHNLHVLALVLLGPALARTSLVVHDPATRPRRRELLARLARLRGWDPVLLVLDTPRLDALEGQHRRGRVLAAASFSRHWARWSEQRPDLLGAARADSAFGDWSRVRVVDRDRAHAVLRELLA